MLYGASYYHEYQPYERLETDLDMMVGAGFTAVRVGESTWASYEPEPGVIGFDALRRVVDAAAGRGLAVVVGTPTYTVPAWMARLHPEIMAVRPDGRTIPYGARQNIDFTHPTFRVYAERVVRAMAEAFAPVQGVVGFQVDNETGVEQLSGPAVVERFRQHVLAAYGSVEEINSRWGLTYWSHRLSTIDDLWGPAGNTNPGYALEWDRFQAGLVLEFLVWQRDLLREHIRPDQFVTHDLVGGHGNPNSSGRGVSQAMDRTGVNVYAMLQRGVELPEPPEHEIATLASADMYPGAWSPVWKADMAYSTGGDRGRRFLVLEAQAGWVGGSHSPLPPWPGQLRTMAHELVARGADMVAYWHWHTLHHGAETYWGGVLGHDLRPGRVLAEVTETAAELRALAPHVADAVPDADVAVLYSWDSHKALQRMPALSLPGGSTPDPTTYHRVFSRLYQGALDARLQVRVVHPDSDWSGHRVLVVPALYVATADDLRRLVAAARDGAHLVLTFRTGYADEFARARTEPQPAHLDHAVGATYQEFTTVPGDVRLVEGAAAAAHGFALPSGATATGWADGLRATTADVLLGYDDPFLGRFAAVTTHALGAGRVTWVGTLPDRGTAAAVVAWAARERGAVPATAVWSDLPASVRLLSATRGDGARVWTLANHSWTPVEVAVPDLRLLEPARPSASDRPGTLALGPWDCRVLVEDVGAA